MTATIPSNLGEQALRADIHRHTGGGFAVVNAADMAQAQLHDELRAALLANPRAIVATPGWGERLAKTPAFEVVQDHFAARDGDDDLVALLAVLGGAARGKNVQADALALINRLCAMHAGFHVADAVEA